MAQLIASSTSAAVSDDFTVAPGTTATLSLFFADSAINPLAVATVQRKGSNGSYANIGQIDGGQPSKVLSSAGTFRVQKSAYAVAFGVDID